MKWDRVFVLPKLILFYIGYLGILFGSLIWYILGIPVRFVKRLYRRGKTEQNMTGVDFEEYCAVYLRKRGFRKIHMTKASGDQGADIICRKKRKKYAVQCKYYSYPVGNKAVQEAYAGMRYYDCDAAMVMTNIHCTDAAKELAEKTGVILMENIPLKRDPYKLRDALTTFAIVLAIAVTVMRDHLWLSYPGLKESLITKGPLAAILLFVVSILMAVRYYYMLY